MSSDLITLAREKLAKQEYAGSTNDYTEGRDFENARTKPITDALLSLAKDAEIVAEHLLVRNMHAEANTLKQALIRIEKAVRGV